VGLPRGITGAAGLLAFGSGALERLLGLGDPLVRGTEPALGLPQHGPGLGELLLGRCQPAARLSQLPLRLLAGAGPVH
jgi:hypothetical protein